MKAIALSNSAIVNNAVKFVRHGMDAATAASKGMLMEALKKRMMAGEVCRFVYQKKDGSTRIAVGTLQPQAVMANVDGYGIPKRFYGMFAYLDLDRMEWRGFREENFVGIIE